MSHTDQITRYIVGEFLPDVSPDQLDPHQDLLADGVIDSLGVLKLIAWVEHTFDVTIGDTDLDPDNFRSVAAVEAYVARNRSAQVAGG
ncbi:MULTISPECIES: acyl carrier protein [Streptomyces]|uniref:acyl carrier protein n=1 Tax=Streptomyces TaxID=1883 RepID=UPI000CD5580A|nr:MULTISPECIES: acyl carrier protein [Streptomyces]